MTTASAARSSASSSSPMARKGATILSVKGCQLTWQTATGRTILWAEFPRSLSTTVLHGTHSCTPGPTKLSPRATVSNCARSSRFSPTRKTVSSPDFLLEQHSAVQVSQSTARLSKDWIEKSFLWDCSSLTLVGFEQSLIFYCMGKARRSRRIHVLFD